jgi:uncharacterized membrane protein
VATIEKSIEVNVPLSAAYNQWTQFEEFPEFMEGVVKIQQLDDRTLHWVMEIGGQHREWDARITEQKRDERIAWRGEGDTRNAGVVTFHRIDDSTTRLMLQLEYYPDDIVETAGDKLGMVSRRVGEDLKRFKRFVESRGQEAGPWRDAVEGPGE